MLLLLNHSSSLKVGEKEKNTTEIHRHGTSVANQAGEKPNKNTVRATDRA